MSPIHPVLIVFLDAYHLDDPFFLSSFARDVQAHVGPIVFVHGGGEGVERTLEARGLLDDDARKGPAAQQLVERAIRELNRRIVHEMNDAGVPAVGILGSDRGLLRMGDGGEVEVGRIDWLVDLVMRNAIPVVGSLAPGKDGDCVEADLASALLALEAAFRASGQAEPAIVAFTNNRKAGLFDGPTLLATVEVDDLNSLSAVGDLEVLRKVGASVGVRLTTPRSLREAGLPNGTDLGGVLSWRPGDVGKTPPRSTGIGTFP